MEQRPPPRAPITLVNPPAIHERRSVEDTSRPSNGFLRSTLDALPLPIVVLDEHGTIVAANTAWERPAGDHDRVMGDRPQRVGEPYCLPGDQVGALTDGIRAVTTRQREEFHLEYPWQEGSGEERWLLVRITRFDEDGAVRVVVTHEDISPRKRLEKELHRRTAFFEAQVNASLDGVLVVDPQERKLLQNRRIAELFEIPPHIANDIDDQHQVRWVTNAIQDPERFIEQVRHLYAHPAATSRDEIELKNGRVLDRYTAPVMGKAGEHYGRIWMFRDVSEKHRTEAALRLQAHTLDHIGRAVIATEPGGRITYVNRYAEQLYGWPAAEILGRNICEVTVPQVIRAQAEQILERLREGQEWGGEFLVHRRDGTLFPAFVAYTPLRDTRGEIIGIVGVSEDITERCRATEEQRQLAEQLAMEKTRLVDAQAVANIGSWEADPASGVSLWSEQTYRICGFDPDQPAPTYQAFLELVHPEDRDRLATTFTRSLTPPATICCVEHRVRLPDGRFKTVEERWETFFGADGTPLRALGTCQDITERKRTEDALREAEANYRSIFEHSSDGIFQHTPDGRFLSANPALARMLGYPSPEEFMRERTADLGHLARVEPALRENFRLLLHERGYVNGFEHEVPRRDGTTIWVCENTRLVRDADGRPAYCEGSVQDISARRRAEEELFRSRQTLRGILDHIPQRVFWKDRDHVFLGCNHAFALDRGFDDPAEVVGKTDFDINSSSMAERYHADERDVMAQNTVKSSYEEPVVFPGGQSAWLRTSKTPMHDGQGRVIGILGTYEDITEHKLAKLEIERLNADLERRVSERTEDLVAAKAEAERANLAKSEFLSRTSHELRTPMNAILGFGQLLEMERGLGPRPRECVEQILNAGRHLLVLIDEVLDISNAEAGRIPLSLSPVAVTPLVQETWALVQPLGASRQINLSPPDLPPAPGEMVLADPQRLKQVLINLLANAIKYNRPGGGVALTCTRTGEPGTPAALRFCVEDNGPGLSAEHVARLFTPFERLDAERTRPEVVGTGLGLALSKRMVELMGGTLGVHSVLGQGSSFWLELPLAPPDAIGTPCGEALPQVQDLPPG